MARGDYPHWRNCTDHQRPGCMSGFIDKDLVFGTHILMSGADALAWKYRMSTATLETVLISTLVSNAIDLPIYFPDDAHYGLLTAVDKLDGVHIIGNSQIGNHPVGRPSSPTSVMHHIVCTNVSDFTNPASWVQGDEPMTGTDTSAVGSTYTYHAVDRLSDGNLIWFATQEDNPTDNAGRDITAWQTNGGHTFTLPLASLTGVAATEGVLVECTDDGVGSGSPDLWYWQAILVQPGAGAGGSDRIHVTGLARDDWTLLSTEQQPLYFYMDTNARGSWFAGDGTALTMPLTSANWSAAIIPGTSGTGLHGWDFMNVTSAGGVTMCYFDGTNYTEYTITAGVWTTGTMAAITGDMVRKWRLKLPNGNFTVWYSSISPLSQRVLITRSTLAQTVRLGPGVKFGSLVGSSYAASFAIGPDPVLLREQGYLFCCIGEGDTPKMYRFPDPLGYRGN